MTSESAVQSIVRRDFAYTGPIWRNNSGACQDATGRLVRYGLGNESKEQNERIKSSDLIGITPVQAYVQSLGCWTTLGVFTALEIKPSDWQFSELDKRAVAQRRFHEIVREHGGFAGFVNDPAQVAQIIRRG